MDVRKTEFPVVVQAYETSNHEEIFIAEQVVNSQVEIDNFTSRYAGKLIKARPLSSVEQQNQAVVAKRKKSSSTPVWLFILLVIVVLIVIGFTTGWIQNNLGIQI